MGFNFASHFNHFKKPLMIKILQKIRSISLLAACVYTSALAAQQDPIITAWIRNTTGATGYNGISSNVQQVQYSANNVYVSASCIPAYSISPWPGNPNIASNQNFVFKFTRNPQQNTGTPTAIGNGHIGVWTNGVSIFNVSDAQSYNNQGIWNRNAYYWEEPSFDNCLGHPQQQGEYHHHVSPKCLYDINDSTKHSPLIGFAFDGFPVYGAYAYASTTGTGTIRRIRSSYQTTTTATRVNGPAVSATYPVGCFIEDYTYTAASGDLDARNGRYCVTPEYPNGTYAYFTTLNATKLPAFPYTFFGSYYGVVQAGNTGPGSGHNTISESVTTYVGTVNGIDERAQLSVTFIPNITRDMLSFLIDPVASNDYSVYVTDMSGKIVYAQEKVQPAITYMLDFTTLAQGVYNIRIANHELSYSVKIPVK
jgi:hypothetical protein